MIRLVVILIGLVALWAVPFVAHPLGLSGGGGCAEDCTFTGQTSVSANTSPQLKLVRPDNAGSNALCMYGSGTARWCFASQATQPNFILRGGTAEDVISVDTTPGALVTTIVGKVVAGPVTLNGSAAPLDIAVTSGYMDIGTTPSGSGVLLYSQGFWRWGVDVSGHFFQNGHNVYDLGSLTASTRNSYTRATVYGTGLALAGLTPTTVGTVLYCTDCLHGSNPCTASSTGAIAKRLNGAWVCN